MPFWKRDKSEAEVARDAFAPAEPPPPPVGTLPCSTTSCARQDALACSYVDHRGRGCRTAACPEHNEVIDGRPHCLLHAGTVRAIGAVGGNSHRPDVDNPAPSLVSWVARDLHDRVRELLDENLRPEDGERVLVDEAVSPFRAADGTRRWEQAWKIVHHAGVALKITVQVEESAPSEITVRVGQRVVSHGEPPWYGRFQRGERISSDAAAVERHEFYEPIQTAIREAVLAERAAGARGGY